MNDFWSKFKTCKHEPYDNYSVYVCCGNEDLGCTGGTEWHCKHCGAYITEDPCGSVSGASGWSIKRWKKKDNKHWSNNVKWGYINGKT